MTFQWDPNADQTYNDNISLILNGTPSTFKKVLGTSFTMDAPWQTLTLQVDAKSVDDLLTHWGASPGSGGTNISLNNGTLVYDAGHSRLPSVRFGLTSTDVTVSGTSSFQIRNTMDVYAGAHFLVEDKGSVDIECGKFTDPNYFRALVQNEATMSVKASYSINMRTGDIECFDWSTLRFEGKSLTCGNGAHFAVGGGSRMSLFFDEIVVDGAQAFTLGDIGNVAGDSAKMLFDSYSSGKSPFDFLNSDYPEGMFQIYTESPNIEFLISYPEDGEAAAAAIVQKKLIKNSLGSADRTYCKFENDGYIHIHYTSE